MIAFLLRRFRWMLVGAGVKYVARRGVGRSVDEAAIEIEDRLPAPVANAMNALPGDVMRAGGAAVVSARAAQRSARAAQRSARAAQRSALTVQRGARVGGVVASRVARAGVAARRSPPAVADRLRSVRETVAVQAELDGRDLRADLQRYLHGGGPDGERAALDALLDRRSVPADEPVPPVPEPVGRGRRRSVPAPPRPEVARVQRSYRRPQKPWDRRRRGESGPGTPVVS